MKKLLTLFAAIIISLASCKKDSGSSNDNSFEDFLLKSQWVGVMDRAGYQFAPPVSIRFTPDNSMVIYAPFFLTENGTTILRDSIVGNILSIEKTPDDKTTAVKSKLEFYGEVTVSIHDRKTLSLSSTNINKPILLELELYPHTGFSLNGTRWSGPVMSGPGPQAGMVAYPDLSTIGFDQSTSYYHRNGAIVKEQPTPQIPTPGELRVIYKQIGAVVYMSGYNENGMLLPPYFGVLKPGNDQMMVFSGAIGSRLPYYTQTIAWYGPAGITPVINKL